MPRVPIERLLTAPQREAYHALKKGPLFRIGGQFRGLGTRPFKRATVLGLVQAGVGMFDPTCGNDGAIVEKAEATQ